VVVTVLAAVILRSLVAQAYYIPSASMLPGLRVNDRVVVSRLAYHLHAVHRGDVVVFDAPPGIGPAPHQHNVVVRLARDVGSALGVVQDQTVLIKRVIGLPGETVSGRDGHVFVDGRVLVEPYLVPGTATTAFAPVKVPAGQVWLLGDNRGDSEDSRIFGTVPERHIVGRAMWRVWPPTRLGFL